MMIRAFLVLMSVFLSQQSAAADSWIFDAKFNSTAKALGSTLRVGKPDCGAEGCNMTLSPTSRLWVSRSDRDIDEAAAYFPHELRSTVDLAETLTVLMAIFSGSQPRTVRAMAVQKLIEDAGGDRRDGELRLGNWRYVVRPSDGKEMRIYATKMD